MTCDQVADDQVTEIGTELWPRPAPLLRMVIIRNAQAIWRP
jgi:hypothetical protein